MTEKVDIAFVVDEDGDLDFAIGEDGDLQTCDGYESSIEMSLSTEKRANSDEVPDETKRRGWIGNENSEERDYEIGSKLWLLEQSRSTQITRNNAIVYAREALESSFVPDDAKRVNVTGDLAISNIILSASIERYSNIIDNISYDLWERTGD